MKVGLAHALQTSPFAFPMEQHKWLLLTLRDYANAFRYLAFVSLNIHKASNFCAYTKALTAKRWCCQDSGLKAPNFAPITFDVCHFRIPRASVAKNQWLFLSNLRRASKATACNVGNNPCDSKADSC